MTDCGAKVKRSIAKKRPLGLVRGEDEDHATWRRRCKKAQSERDRAENPERFAARQKTAWRAYYANNAEKRRQSTREYKQQNEERVQERDRQRKASIRAKDPERLREFNRRWAKNNPERAKEFRKRFYSQNPHAFAASNAKRRASRRSATPAWADLKAIREIYREAHRLTKVTGIQHHVDHEIPLQGDLVSGLHVENNLQILTAAENLKKGNRWPQEMAS